MLKPYLIIVTFLLVLIILICLKIIFMEYSYSSMNSDIEYKMTNLKDVAKKAGVSTATVSRVINNENTVKPATKEKVLAAMATLNYRPNAAARRLAGGKSHVIGFMISEYRGPVFSHFLDEIENNLRLFDRHMVVASGRANEEKERESIQFLQNSDVDGLILYSEVLPDSELIKIAQQIPTVILNRHVDELASQCVWQDNTAGMEQILTHIHEQNFTNIALITGSLNKPDGYLRQKALIEKAKQLKIKFQAIEESDFTITSGYQAMQSILAKKLPLDAVLCANDESALGALKAISEAGLACPKDIALTGYDNIPSLEAASTNITTIELPIEDMCKETCKLIMNLVYGQNHVIKNRFTPKLIIRCSSEKNIT